MARTRGTLGGRLKKRPAAIRRRLSFDEYAQWKHGGAAARALRRAMFDELRIAGKRAYLVLSPDDEPLFYVHANDDPSFYGPYGNY